MKFKVGDKVIIIDGEPSVGEENGGLGMKGVIKEINPHDPWLLVSSDEFTSSSKIWFFLEEQLELIEDKPTSNLSSGDWNTICLRCGAPAYVGLFSVTCSKCK